MSWWREFGFGGRSADGPGDGDGKRGKRRSHESRRRRNWGQFEPLEDRRLMAIDWQASASVRSAIVRATDLSQYSPAQMAQTTQWVVGISTPGTEAQLGAKVSPHASREVGLLNNAYVWDFGANATSQSVASQLSTLQGLDYFYPLVPIHVQTRAVPNDPYFPFQWHLQNTGFNSQGGLPGADANVVDAWDIATGAGVVIGIVDDGLQYLHPDLAARYRPDLSFDFVEFDTDPAPGLFDFHGTAVAGVAAATGNNGIGVSGAAPDASLAGIRLLGGPLNDLVVAEALTHRINDIDIYNNSWGPGPFVIANNPLALAAMQITATMGRNGLGGIITWAGGNEGGAATGFDNVNFDLYANSIYVIAVAAINGHGVKSEYSDEGAAIFISAYSNDGNLGITTTDIVGEGGYNGTSFFDGDLFPDPDYTSTFGGTSSATPLVSGVIALMLEANPNLTYRDVQEILAKTARKNDPNDSDWTVNGAGYHINHKYGFGAIDALPAVQMAQTWVTGNPQQVLTTGAISVNKAVPENNHAGVTSTAYIPQNLKVERVEVTFNAQHFNRGDLHVELISPDGTVSVLAPANPNHRKVNYDSWTFSSVRHWGESSQGEWTLRVSDRDGNRVSGTFIDWKLNIYCAEGRAPVAEDDFASGFEDVPLVIPVLANDFDHDNNIVPGSVQIVSQPAHGTVTVNRQTGEVTYLGNQDFFGVDTFSYRVADTMGQFSNVATVTVVLENINDPPVAVNDIGKSLAGPIVVNVLANDFDVDSPLEPSSVTIVSGPHFGSAVVNPVSGAITYTPPDGFVGGDELFYTITDADGAVSNLASVRFRVGAPISLAGQVYIDNNGNGVRDPGEQGLPGVTLMLTKTDGPFTFTESVITGSDGSYVFSESANTIFPTGVYTITQVQPSAFHDGAEQAGSHAHAFYSNDQFGGIALPTGANSTGWLFAERGLKADFLASYIGAQMFMASSQGGTIESVTLGGASNANPVAALAGLSGIASFQVSASPAGLALNVNGQKSTSELLVVGVPGTTSTLAAPALQTLNGKTYIFDSWSDGGASNRTVAAGSVTQNLVANYRLLDGPTTNIAYVMSVSNQLGIASLSAEMLKQLSGQLDQGGSRAQVANSLWKTADNFGRRVDALFQGLLRRPADAAGRASYVSRLMAGASENDIAAEMLASVEYAQAGRLTTIAFVDSLYRDVLGRAADAAGRALWVQQLNQGRSRLEVAKAFLNSDERRSLVVDQLYREILGRPADAAGRAYYVALLRNGSLTDSTMAAQLLSSDEFIGRSAGSQSSAGETAFARAVYVDVYGRAPTASELASWSINVSLGISRLDMVAQLWQTADAYGRRVDQLYQSILRRPADAAGRAEHVNRMLAGASEDEIALAMITSTEYQQRYQSNAAFVDALYRDVLKRAPDAAGRAGWTSVLNQGRSRSDVARSFLTSDEHYLRVIDGFYTSLLGRAADAAGRSFYLGQFRSGVLTTAAAAERMIASDEYFARASRRRL